MIDLITGHQGVAHISADQIASINNAMMDNYGANKVMRLVGGELTANGLTIEVSTGYWRANGFDMEVQEAETIYIDPTASGVSRIDNIYVEILQDIPTGAQRSEIVTVNGEPSATPTAPEAPTAPELNTDILLQVVPLASVTVTEGAMVMTDLSVAYEMVTPSELEAVETIATGAQTAAGNAQTTANTASTNANNALGMIRSTSSDAYSSSKAYSVGDHVIYNNKVYKCITACSAGSWATNHSCFSQTTLTSAVTDLNSDLNVSKLYIHEDIIPSTVGSKFTEISDTTWVFVVGAIAYNATNQRWESIPVLNNTSWQNVSGVNVPVHVASFSNNIRIYLNNESSGIYAGQSIDILYRKLS